MLNGFLYVIGGKYSDRTYRSVERFNPATNTWSPVADLLTGRRNAGICCFQIYFFRFLNGFLFP